MTLSDEVLHDHFPDYPVLPGAFVIESMAQLRGFLPEVTMNRPGSIRRALLVQIDRAGFHKPAGLGDCLVLHARLGEQIDDAAKIDVRVDLYGKKMATSALTFLMKEIDSEKIHEQRRYVYALWTRHLEQKPEIL